MLHCANYHPEVALFVRFVENGRLHWCCESRRRSDDDGRMDGVLHKLRQTKNSQCP